MLLDLLHHHSQHTGKNRECRDLIPRRCHAARDHRGAARRAHPSMPPWNLERRTDFLASYLRSTGLKTLVLGISGGVDSLTAGCLAQRAVEAAACAKLRRHAMSAPDAPALQRAEKDEAEAQRSLTVMKPDRTITVDIRPAADGMLAALKAGDHILRDAAHELRARQHQGPPAHGGAVRSGRRDGIVIGTDHAAEALMGLLPPVRRRRDPTSRRSPASTSAACAPSRSCSTPDELWSTVAPTADLESLVPTGHDERLRRELRTDRRGEFSSKASRCRPRRAPSFSRRTAERAQARAAGRNRRSRRAAEPTGRGPSTRRHDTRHETNLRHDAHREHSARRHRHGVNAPTGSSACAHW